MNKKQHHLKSIHLLIQLMCTQEKIIGYGSHKLYNSNKHPIHVNTIVIQECIFQPSLK